MGISEVKLARIQSLLEGKGLDALLLRRVSSFAWATDGAASYVNMATTEGVASLVVTPRGRYVVADTIESPRLAQEERMEARGWELRTHPWYEADDVVSELTSGLRLGADIPHPGATDLSGEVARLRAMLTPEEGERFRSLAKLCADAMDSAARSIKPGQTEYEMAALLGQEAQRRGAQPIVNLIATDERIFSFRHPLPTAKKLERYAMLVLCGRRDGLVCSLTRFVHFGKLPDEIRRKAESTAKVDAAFIASTRPGRTLGDIFDKAASVYAAEGYPGEWKLHHQGGTAGYEAREYLGTPGSTDVVSAGQAFAWNPSITGTKSEDTILVAESGSNEVLTDIAGWPQLHAEWEGTAVSRPAILEIT